MTRDDVISTIRVSVARGTKTPQISPLTRDQYIAQELELLLSWAIAPVPAVIVGQAFGESMNEFLDGGDCFAVARAREHWLLYAPKTGLFAAAHGYHSGELSALGFFSADALAEWLG